MMLKLVFWISTLNLFWGKFGLKKPKLSVLPENWNTSYLRGADSKYGLTFLKFWLKNPFLGKFWQKNPKLFVLPENWHLRYLGRAGTKSGVRFSKFRSKNLFLGKFGPKKHSLLILIWDLGAVFVNTASFGFVLQNCFLFKVFNFKIALHSSAAFYKQFWKYDGPIYIWKHVN